MIKGTETRNDGIAAYVHSSVRKSSHWQVKLLNAKVGIFFLSYPVMPLVLRSSQSDQKYITFMLMMKSHYATEEFS